MLRRLGRDLCWAVCDPVFVMLVVVALLAWATHQGD